MQDPAIVADNLTVVREKVQALDGVSFSITAGKITGLIGPSGSGKTTLMRSIIGAQKLTKGGLQVLGRAAGNKELRHKLGYVSQNPAVYPDLTVAENLQYFAVIVGCSAKQITKVLDQVDLVPQTNQTVQSLSGGQLARVSLAVALLVDAELLVLDEPTVGLDPVLRRDLWNLFSQLADQGRTLLISSHVMDEAERCQELLLLRDGKVLSHSTKAELLAKTHKHDVGAAFLSLIEEGSHAS